MLEPTLALQTAVRGALIASPEVTALVPAEHIRAGSTIPASFPCMILKPGQTLFMGRAAGSQLVARAFLDLHIWAVEDGAGTARAIGMAAMMALLDAPATEGCAVDEWAKPHVMWLRDPAPDQSYAHGVMNLEAVIRWRV